MGEELAKVAKVAGTRLPSTGSDPRGTSALGSIARVHVPEMALQCLRQQI
jgi:hypothetical protein